MPGQRQPQVVDEVITIRLTTDFPTYGLRVGDHIAVDAHGPVLQRPLRAGEIPPEVWDALARISSPGSGALHPQPAARPRGASGPAFVPALRLLP